MRFDGEFVQIHLYKEMAVRFALEGIRLVDIKTSIQPNHKKDP